MIFSIHTTTFAVFELVHQPIFLEDMYMHECIFFLSKMMFLSPKKLKVCLCEVPLFIGKQAEIFKIKPWLRFLLLLLSWPC